MWTLFDIDGLLYRTLTKISQIIWLNILWLLGCLPIITIGASTIALYYVTMKMVRDEEGYVAKDFFRSFKRNFRQGIIIFFIVAGIGFVLLQDYRYFNYLDIEIGKLGAFISLIIYGLITVIIFPLLAKFDNSIMATLKNAIYLASQETLSAVAVLIMVCVAGYGVYTSVFVMKVFILCGGAVMAYGSSYLFRRIFDKYAKEMQDENQKEN